MRELPWPDGSFGAVLTSGRHSGTSRLAGRGRARARRGRARPRSRRGVRPRHASTRPRSSAASGRRRWDELRRRRAAAGASLRRRSPAAARRVGRSCARPPERAFVRPPASTRRPNTSSCCGGQASRRPPSSVVPTARAELGHLAADHRRPEAVTVGVRRRPGRIRGGAPPRPAPLPLALLAFGSAEAQGTGAGPGRVRDRARDQDHDADAGGDEHDRGHLAARTPRPPPAAFRVSRPTARSSRRSRRRPSATTAVAQNASAKAESVVTGVSLFGGEITADAVTARASAGTGHSGAGGNANGSGVTNLRRRRPAGHAGTTSRSATGAQLTVGSQTVDRTAPAGTTGYQGLVTELDLRLTADHGGLPASSEIQIGYAEVARADRAAGATATTTTTTTTDDDAGTDDGPSVGDSPSDRPAAAARSSRHPLEVQPEADRGPLRLPGLRPDVVHRHVRRAARRRHLPPRRRHLRPARPAARRVSPTGRSSRSAGTRSAATGSGSSTSRATSSTTRTSPRSRPAATNGAHVKAGQVVGFMGNTGDAEGTPVPPPLRGPPGLAPLSRLRRRGRPDAVPRRLEPPAGSRRSRSRAAGRRPSPAGRRRRSPARSCSACTDISTADGLDPASLERALTPLERVSADADARPDRASRRRATSAAASRRSARRRSRLGG